MTPIGCGVIGVGVFGENHCLAYSRLPGVKLAAVCDVNGARARAMAEKYGARAWYTDYQELLRDPAVQAVSIATPDFAHRAIALAAARAGKHILCEKPLATTAADAQEIVDAARAAGVKLMVDFHNRVNPPFVAARQSIEVGAIGRARVRLRAPQQHHLRAHGDVELGKPFVGAMVPGQPLRRT